MALQPQQGPKTPPNGINWPDLKAAVYLNKKLKKFLS
jgi:hypothetical protein